MAAEAAAAALHIMTVPDMPPRGALRGAVFLLQLVGLMPLELERLPYATKSRWAAGLQHGMTT